MAASDHLGLQFEHRDLGSMRSVVGAHPETGHTMAYLDWAKTSTTKYGSALPKGSVAEVFVHPYYRGRGVARHMWNTARELDPDVRHAPEPTQTPAGKGWARAVGD